MSKTFPPRLPLRIPGGWLVRHNELRELDPDAMAEDDPDWTLLTQDLAQLQQAGSGLLVDVGWSPQESPRGAFRVKVIVDDDWQRPIATCSTRKLEELVAALEVWLQAPPEIPTPRLIERLADPRPELRGSAAVALARRNALEAIEPIREAMGREKDQATIDRLLRSMHALIHERTRQQSP
jgi:hypothetical protein